MAWAFAMAGEPVPALLNPMAVLDEMEARGAEPQVCFYQMSMHGLAATCPGSAGFALLAQAEACGLLFHSKENYFAMFHTLLKAYHTTNNSGGTSLV